MKFDKYPDRLEIVLEKIPDFECGKVFFLKDDFFVVLYVGAFGCQYERRERKTLKLLQRHSLVYPKFFALLGFGVNFKEK